MKTKQEVNLTDILSNVHSIAHILTKYNSLNCAINLINYAKKCLISYHKYNFLQGLCFLLSACIEVN